MRLRGDVDGLRVNLRALPTPARGDLLDLFGLDIADHQLRLLRLEAGDDRLANALGRAGDHHHLVFQAIAVLRLGDFG